MGKFLDRLERSATKAHCNPSVVLLALAVVLALVVYHYRAAILLTIELTLLGLGSLFVATGLALLGRTVYRWRHAAQPQPAVVAPAPKPARVAGEDADAMIDEATHLARPEVSLSVEDLPEGFRAKS
jgi:hypothetical protein